MNRGRVYSYSIHLTYPPLAGYQLGGLFSLHFGLKLLSNHFS